MADVENQPQPEQTATLSAPDGFQVANFVGNYLGEHKNSMNNRTQARLGVAIKGLTHHLLGTKEHYAAEKIQSALKRPFIHYHSNDISEGEIPLGRAQFQFLADLKARNHRWYRYAPGEYKRGVDNQDDLNNESGMMRDRLMRRIDRGR
eukprot:SAG31_NODE_18044_length_648_cov_3.047359_1_plen_149_part_00